MKTSRDLVALVNGSFFDDYPRESENERVRKLSELVLVASSSSIVFSPSHCAGSLPFNAVHNSLSLHAHLSVVEPRTYVSHSTVIIVCYKPVHKTNNDVVCGFDISCSRLNYLDFRYKQKTLPELLKNKTICTKYPLFVFIFVTGELVN